MKTRLDEQLLIRNQAESLAQARAYIMAGEVQVNGQVCYRSDVKVSESSRIMVIIRNPYVSRGAFKIKNGIESFNIVPAGLKVLDIGISTGGFTDYLLKNGAQQVVGLDVNIGQVDYNLKKDKRLVLVKQNARFLKKDQLGFEPDLITIDVSFISVVKILPRLKQFARARILALIKPQFEAKKSEITPGGVLRETRLVQEILVRTKKKIEELGFALTGFASTGIKGRKGNQEFFFQLEYGKKKSIDDRMVIDGTEI